MKVPNIQSVIPKANSIKIDIAPIHQAKTSAILLEKSLLSKTYDLGVKAANKSFSGLTEGIAKSMCWLAEKKPVQGFAKMMSKTDSVRHLTALSATVLSAFYMRETWKSKKIEQDQKKPLIINQGLVALASLVGAYTVDKLLERKYAKFSETFLSVNKRLIGGNIGKYSEGLRNARTLIVFGLIYRFFAPVIMTPIANGLSGIKKNTTTVKKESLPAQAKLVNTKTTAVTAKPNSTNGTGDGSAFQSFKNFRV